MDVFVFALEFEEFADVGVDVDVDVDVDVAELALTDSVAADVSVGFSYFTSTFFRFSIIFWIFSTPLSSLFSSLLSPFLSSLLSSLFTLFSSNTPFLIFPPNSSPSLFKDLLLSPLTTPLRSMISSIILPSMRPLFTISLRSASSNFWRYFKGRKIVKLTAKFSIFPRKTPWDALSSIAPMKKSVAKLRSSAIESDFPFGRRRTSEQRKSTRNVYSVWCLRMCRVRGNVKCKKEWEWENESYFHF